MSAFRPVWFTVALSIFTAMCNTAFAQWVSGWLTPLLTHPLTIAAVAAALLTAKFPKVCGRLRVFAIRVQIAVLTLVLHVVCTFHEACRSHPRVSRSMYTRTKVGQRRAFGAVRCPTNPKIHKVTRRERLRAKAQPQAAKARVASILARLAKDAAASKRRRLGQLPDGPSDEEEYYPKTAERSWRNPVPDSYCSPRLAQWVALLVKALTLTLLITTIVSLLALPVAMGVGPTNSAVGIAANSGFINYAAAEVQAQQKEDLARLKLQPHQAEEIQEQFAHGINAHVPDGVQVKVNPEEYWKDPVTKLTMHRLPHLEEEQFQSLVRVLQEHHKDVVAYTLTQITGYVGREPPLSIDLDTDKPIFQPPRRNFSQAEKEIADEKCDDLLASGVVKEIKHSNYACNIVLAAKRAPDGTWSDKRFCVNFIPINKHTELDRYGSHRAEDLFHKVTSAKYLTALDLRSGFHQIPVDEKDRCKAAFWWVSARNQPPKLLAYQRMPFGLKNAPAKFQRVMDSELTMSGCAEFAFAYIDDLLIASNTWEEHVIHVDKVLRMLISCDLRIHPDKSVFGTNIVEYLGHNVIGEHGITMNGAKVEAIKVLPDPTNVPELRSILGFLSYYRHFIPGFSSLAAPMTELLQKDKPWRWGPEQQKAYAHLKKEMSTYGRVLRRIDPNRELILHTDWSNHGIGAVLGQKDDDGNEYLCGCISRSLNKHEKNYPSYKGELLALAWAVRSFRTHIHGTKFRLVTDHQPLLWLMKARDLTGQYSRWQMLLQEYDFNMEHRAGIKHQNADVLSRFPCKSTEDLTGARMDVEHIAASIRSAGGDPWAWACPHHGPSCPGRPLGKHPKHIVKCPEHGNLCRSKSCAKLLEAQYTWDATARRWTDPTESRDTCMECCTEALWEHPLKDETCHYVCHKCSGITVKQPPTPPRGRKSSIKPTTPRRKVTFAAIGTGSETAKPEALYRGQAFDEFNPKWRFERERLPAGTSKEDCLNHCYQCGMEFHGPKLGAIEASETAYWTCREACKDEETEIKISKPKATIDAFAPSFSDFIDSNNTGFLGRDCYMNNGLRQAYEPESYDAGLGEHSRLEQHAEAAKLIASTTIDSRARIRAIIPVEAKARISSTVPTIVEKLAADPSVIKVPESKLDLGIVSSSFFPKPLRTASL
jgi:hypothetical protein